MGQRCSDSVGRPAGTLSQGPTRRALSGCLGCLGWARNWRVEGLEVLKAGEKVLKFGKKFQKRQARGKAGGSI